MKEWSELRSAALPWKKGWEDGLAHTPEALAPRVRSALRALDSEEPPPKDVELAGVLVALMANRPHFDVACGFLAAQGGVRYALEGVLSAQRWIEEAGPDDEREIELGPWLALRALVRDADASSRAEATEAAVAARPNVRPQVRFALAWTFPNEPALFTDEDQRYGLSCAEDPGVVHDLAWLRKVDRDIANLPRPKTLVEHLGARALSPLRRYVTRGVWGQGDDAAVLVKQIGGETAISILAEGSWREKDVLSIFVRAAREDPAAAAPAISKLLAAGPPKHIRRFALFTPVLEAVLRSIELRPPAREAAADALPPPLASPPWKTAPAKPKAAGKAKKASPAAAVDVPHEERIDFTPRDRKELFAVDASDEPDRLKRITTEQEKEETFFFFMFQWLSDATALRLMSEIPVQRWYGGVDDLEAMLARFDLVALEPALAYVKRQPDRFEAMLAVDSPRVAPIAAHLFATSKKNAEVAAKWLERFPRAAAVGLVRAIAHEKGKTRDSCEKALAHVRRKAKSTVDEVVALAGASALVDERAALAATKPVKAPKLAPWLDVATLPRPLLPDGSALSLEATRDLVSLVALSDRRDPLAALAVVADALDAASLDRFAWGLFTAWLAEGGPPKHPYGLDVLGIFGTPATLRVLTAVARDWAPAGLPQRAQASVDVLALARSDAGLLGIHRLTQVRSRALAKHATKVLAAAAMKRGLGKEDLVDRLVPDLGLDGDGSYVFDYGPRSFTLAFDEEMQPYVRDQKGAKLASLPKPAASDDAELTGEAESAWKSIKKGSREIARVQSRRLEVALATDRRFSVDHFEAYFAKHPLLSHLARRLVWTGRSAAGDAISFRVSEDGGYVRADDSRVELDPSAPVMLAHPLRLGAKEAGAWGEHFGEHEIVQPFQQLGRSTFAPTDAERSVTSLERYAKKTAPTPKILGLDRAGWARTDPIQGGRVYAWQKPSSGLVALLPIDPGIYLGSPKDDPEQTLGPVQVAREGDQHALPLGELDPVFFSELVRDLSALFD